MKGGQNRKNTRNSVEARHEIGDIKMKIITFQLGWA